MSLWGLAGVYFVILLLWEKSIDVIYYIAAGIWFFNGIYWINYHVLQFELTSFANRWNYTGLKKMLMWVNKLFIPSIIGLIISFDYLGYWYEIAFWIGMILFIVAWYLGNISLDLKRDTKFRFKKLYKKARENKNVFRSLYTHSFTGFSFWNTIIEVVIGLIIFQEVESEGKLGLILSAFSVVSLIAMWAFGKFVSYKKYKNAIWILGVLYSFILFWFISVESFIFVLIFSSLIGIFADFFSLPQKVISDNVLHEIKDYKEYRTEYMVLREVFLWIWWVSSFTLLYFINGISTSQLKYLFIAMIVLTLFSTYKLASISLDKK